MSVRVDEAGEQCLVREIGIGFALAGVEYVRGRGIFADVEDLIFVVDDVGVASGCCGDAIEEGSDAEPDAAVGSCRGDGGVHLRSRRAGLRCRYS